MLYGIKHHPVIDEIELVEDYPANVAQMLIDDRADIGLIPVAATTRLKDWHVVGDYCIGCEGAVASVCIFSEVPMEEVQTVLLDYQSRTSVNLAKILLKEYWKKEVVFVDASGEDFRSQIQGTTAGVVIGDRALQQRSQSKYIYDLGEAWMEHSGLPFVFAAWIANKPLPEAFEKKFNEANAEGLKHIAAVVSEYECPYYNLMEYYTKNVNYHLDENKKLALSLFLKKLAELAY